MAKRPTAPLRRILVVDVGGTHVKVAVVGGSTEFRFVSGPKMDPAAMVLRIRRRMRGVAYDAVSIGYPGVVVHGRIVSEPAHLAPGWAGYDFARAFGRPARVLNDAAMQALGGYRGGRMLFLGLGTGLGSAMIVDHRIEPMELAHLPFKKGRTFEEYVGEAGRERLGRRKWRKAVFDVVAALSTALEPDYVVLGGGNVRRLKELPPNSERGDNRNAFRGGARMWERA